MPEISVPLPRDPGPYFVCLIAALCLFLRPRYPLFAHCKNFATKISPQLFISYMMTSWQKFHNLNGFFYELGGSSSNEQKKVNEYKKYESGILFVLLLLRNIHFESTLGAFC